MHGANLDHMSCLLAFEDTVSAASGHSSYVQQLRAIDHVIIFTTSYTHALGLYLEAKAAFVFPQRCSHAGFHPWRCNLSGVVKLMWLVVTLCAWNGRCCRYRGHGRKLNCLGYQSRTHRRRGRQLRRNAIGVTIRGISRRSRSILRAWLQD